MCATNFSADEQRECSEQICKLWDELAVLCPQHIDEALRHCMSVICDMAGADDACWFGMVRVSDTCKPAKGRPIAAKYEWRERPIKANDPTMGWRIGALARMTPLDPEAERARYKEIQQLDDKEGDTNRTFLAEAGQFRVYSLHDGTIDLAAFQKTEHYDFFYRQSRISDRLWIVFPVTANTESCFVFDICGRDERFSADAIGAATQCLRGIKWFHHQALLSHGLGISEASLTPVERRVASLLLTGATEKEIAERMSVKPGSVHQYCVDIYQKYGVRGRLEFMALWLNVPRR